MSIKKRTQFVLVYLLVGAMMASAFAATAKRTKSSGKKGEITIVQPVKVGNLVLQPGDYTVQHRASGEKDIIRFVELKRDPINYFWNQRKIRDVACRVEPAAQVADKTSFSTDADTLASRVTEITIRGELAVYRF